MFKEVNLHDRFGGVGGSGVPYPQQKEGTMTGFCCYGSHGGYPPQTQPPFSGILKRDVLLGLQSRRPAKNCVLGVRPDIGKFIVQQEVPPSEYEKTSPRIAFSPDFLVFLYFPIFCAVLFFLFQAEGSKPIF